jgi:fructose-1,6-bisphosphatase II
VAAGIATTPSGARRSTPGTTWTGCCTPTTWSPGTTTFFVATGITDGELLPGVRYTPQGAQTESIVMRSRSGTIRSVRSRHSLAKVAQHQS